MAFDLTRVAALVAVLGTAVLATVAALCAVLAM